MERRRKRVGQTMRTTTAFAVSLLLVWGLLPVPSLAQMTDEAAKAVQVVEDTGASDGSSAETGIEAQNMREPEVSNGAGDRAEPSESAAGEGRPSQSQAQLSYDDAIASGRSTRAAQEVEPRGEQGTTAADRARKLFERSVDVLSSTDAQASDSALRDAYGEHPESPVVAGVFLAIARELGLNGAMVSSDSGERCWDLVEVDGLWYHVDVWAAVQARQNGGSEEEPTDELVAQWLLIGDEELCGRDGTRAGWSVIGEDVDSNSLVVSAGSYAWETTAGEKNAGDAGSSQAPDAEQRDGETDDATSRQGPNVTPESNVEPVARHVDTKAESEKTNSGENRSQTQVLQKRAQASEESASANKSPAQNGGAAGGAGETQSAEHAAGSIPIDVKVPSIHDENEHGDGLLSVQGSLPSSYDSRNSGRVTALRDQGPFGTCWSFCTIAALESSLLAHDSSLSASSLDLSERHLAYFTYHQQDDALGNLAGDATIPRGKAFGDDMLDDDPYLISGSNYYVASMGLASWAGAVEEAVAPYQDMVFQRYRYTSGGIIAPIEQGRAFLEAMALEASLARSQNAAWLTGFRLISFEEKDDVKAAIMSHGGVAAQINSDTKYRSYRNVNGVYTITIYNPDRSVPTNHGVEIVGWDDDLDRMNFGNHYFNYTGYREKPADTTPVQLDAQVQLDGNQTWRTFVPASDGVYRLTTQYATYPSAYCLDGGNDKLASAKWEVVPDSDGHAIDCEMLAGRTYYLSVPSTSNPGETVTVTRVGDIDMSDVPEHDGAWLAKNSWGSYDGEDGYAWIPYDDVSFCNGEEYGEAGVFLAQREKPYDNNYQYDGGSSTNENRVSSGGSIANVFEARANSDGAEELRAVAMRLNDVNVDYSIQVYLNPTSPNNPTSGVPALASPVTGSTDYMGYYTVDLPQPIALQEGSKFAVVATLSHRNGSDVQYAIDTTYERDWVHQISCVHPGQSFERDAAGRAWDDLSASTCDEGDLPGSCARIKAFTDNVDSVVVSMDKVTISSIATQTYTGRAICPKPVVKYGDTTLREGTDYTVSYKNNTHAGTATVTVSGRGDYAGTKSATFRIVARTFPDVPTGAWYADVVSRSAGLGLINGYNDGRFGPNDRITRGQAAVVLWNMAGGPAAGSGARSFPDVASGAYYYRAVRWASSAGVVSGYTNGKFGPNDDVTREQLAAMLANYARSVAGRKTPGSAADFASMKDRAKVSRWAVPSVGWCFRNQILSGTADGRVNPQGNATRAEAAKMVVVLHDMLA